MNKFDHLNHIRHVAAADIAYVDKKDRQYGASWKKRGGVGAFMMLARKWDRLEEFMSGVFSYDIFSGVVGGPEGEDGTVLAEIRDLRRYLLLVESEMVSRGVVTLGPQLSAAQQQMKEDLVGHQSIEIIPDGTKVKIKWGGEDIVAEVTNHDTWHNDGKPYIRYRLYDEAGNEYFRNRDQIEVPPGPGRLYEAAVERIVAPVEPSATGQATTLAGDNAEAPTVLPFSHEVRREPILLTNFEYVSLKGQEILHGRLYSTAHAEHFWQDLYWQKDDGRWEMHTQHQEEYGK